MQTLKVTSFRKINIKKNIAKPSACHALIDKRNKLKTVFCNAQEKQALDLQIAEILLKEEVKKASHFNKFGNITRLKVTWKNIWI